MQIRGHVQLLTLGLAALSPLWLAPACTTQETPPPDPMTPPESGGSAGTSSPPAGSGGSSATAGSGSTSGGSGGAGVSAGSGGSAGSSPTPSGGSAGTPATGGSATTAGSGGAPASTKDCFTKTTLSVPLLTDFESYDGVMPATGEGSWTFQVGTAYAGLYVLSEETPPGSGTTSTSYLLDIAAGANASQWAAHGANPTTADWGGGIGFWMGCLNATAYAGVSFYVKGTTPTGMLGIALATEDTSPPDATDPAKGGTCDPAPASGCSGPATTLAIPAEWTLITLPWGSFTAGVGASGVAVPATGDRITGISITAGMVYTSMDDGGTYQPAAGAFDVSIDDLGFY
jgi:hypothetical protein